MTARRTACNVPGCDRPKLPGGGHRYCQECRDEKRERRRVAALETSARWRATNAERKKAAGRQYYKRTAERQREKARAWHHANKDRAHERSKAYRARVGSHNLHLTKYGITGAEYAAMLAAQNGTCAICSRTENGKRGHFDVDHDHETGEIRGLLCNRCNRLLANARDEIGILFRAIDYLMPDIEAVA